MDDQTRHALFADEVWRIVTEAMPPENGASVDLLLADLMAALTRHAPDAARVLRLEPSAARRYAPLLAGQSETSPLSRAGKARLSGLSAEGGERC